MSFLRIPLELRQLGQWVVWRYEDMELSKPTKVPYHPSKISEYRTPLHAKVNDPATWATFEECTSALLNSNGGFSGIGFMFSENDPYAFIDFDDHKGDEGLYNRQLMLFHEFNSYSEISPGGKGLHIIVKGSIPSGRKRSGIELYSSRRFATMTGNVYAEKAIADRNELLNQLWTQLGGVKGATAHTGDAPQTRTDEEVLAMALAAANGERFHTLLKGDWNALYQSASEADLAFIDILAFYTQNADQIRRMYKASILGQAPKSGYLHRADREDYVNHMIHKSFDNILPLIDIEGLRNAIEQRLTIVEPQLEPAPQLPLFNKERSGGIVPSVLAVPPGLMGEIAQYIYRSSIRPVPEIALAAAISLMAGITGRAYNVNSTGLNQYVLVLAGTGTGKESAATGMQRLIAAIRTRVPAATSFIGPGKINSEPALINYLAKKSQCFVAIIGEFGLFMQDIGARNANSNQRGIKKLLLDLYNKSGAGQVLLASIYSDSDKSTDVVQSPAFSMFGESTHETYYNILNEALIAEGMLPRFLIIEYNGPRVRANEGFQSELPPRELLDRLATLCAHSYTLSHNGKVQPVAIEQPAHDILKEFDRFADDQINYAGKEVIKHLWTRAHMKALRLAATVAVGCNPYEPKISRQIAEWAIAIVQNDTRQVITRFETGNMGSENEESKQQDKLRALLAAYVKSDLEDIQRRINVKFNRTMFDDKIVPYAYIQQRLSNDSAFRSDRMGATTAIKRSLQAMLDGGDLREMSRNDLAQRYQFNGRAFIITNPLIIH